MGGSSVFSSPLDGPAAPTTAAVCAREALPVAISPSPSSIPSISSDPHFSAPAQGRKRGLEEPPRAPDVPRRAAGHAARRAGRNGLPAGGHHSRMRRKGQAHDTEHSSTRRRRAPGDEIVPHAGGGLPVMKRCPCRCGCLPFHSRPTGNRAWYRRPHSILTATNQIQLPL